MKSMLVEIRSVTITEKGQIVIPKELRKMKGFKKGEKIAILAYDNRIELRPIEQINEGIGTYIASEKSLAKSWNSKEDDKAWKNL
jgi:AbrB family looped-hinge helix DNA binding protein